MTRYYEDVEVGQTDEFGGYEVTREEIVEFAEKYDPQPFHLDEDAARDSIFGGLVASGWHTAAVTMRMVVDHFLSDSASMGSPGIDELRWQEPVRPGDVLRVRVEVLDKRVSENTPGLGIIRWRWGVLNQDDDEVMSLVSTGFIATRQNPSE